MISARLKFVVCFVKSHRKLFPFCCLFRGKVRLKKNCTKKRTFFSPRRLRIPRGIHRRRRRKREKTTRERSFVVVAETERLKSSDRPRCGPGIGVASRGYFKYLSARIFMHFSSSDKKNSHENLDLTFYSSNLIYSYSHHHITIIDRQQREQHTLYK